jgi:aryl-alcohol dehydrogenase
MQVRAAVVNEPGGAFELENLEMSEPRDDEVLVRIVGVGICHTDLICRDQQYPVPLPAVFGHEGSGIVESVGAGVSGLQQGDHVVLSFNACGTCCNCLAGIPTRCTSLFEANFSGARSDGSCAISSDGNRISGHFFAQSSFATYAIANQANVVKICTDVPLELMGPLGCGFQTGAGAVFNSLQPGVGDTLAVFGCGSVGLTAVMAAKAVGCARIFAVDPKAERRHLAIELGATDAIDPADSDPVEAIYELSGGGIDFSLECTGLPEVLSQALESLSVTGCCGLVGAAPLGTRVNLDMNSIMFGRTIKGVIEGDSVPKLFIPRLIELYRKGLFPIDKLVTFYSLEEIEQAVRDSESGRVVKAILRP